QQDVGADLADIDPLGANLLGQLGQRGVNRILDQHQRGAEIGADREGNGQRVAAVAPAGGLHVDRVLNPVDRLLDRNADGAGQDLGARPRVGAGYLDGGRNYLRVVGDGQAVKAYRAEQDRDDRDDVGQDRALDEEFGHRSERK